MQSVLLARFDDDDDDDVFIYVCWGRVVLGVFVRSLALRRITKSRPTRRTCVLKQSPSH